ncbi:MAG: hypothetical protein LAT82_03945 [Nanoarchaeota archaeon]|nr:hypothetical protein [Nanoarchaeota archaeon]
MNIQNQFLILVIGPSGVGKNTLIELFMKKYLNFTFLVTGTARKRRKYEINGVHRHFYSTEEFEKGIENNEFIEYAIVHQTYYGVPKKSILVPISKGLSVIGEVDYQGAYTFEKKIKELPCKLITVFVEFENEELFVQRILSREKLDEESINIRKKSMEKEMLHKNNFDINIISYENDIEKTFNEFETKILEKMNNYN